MVTHTDLQTGKRRIRSNTQTHGTLTGTQTDEQRKKKGWGGGLRKQPEHEEWGSSEVVVVVVVGGWTRGLDSND
nr:hypothetical protein BaRGS_017060 [Batillaria attramentaria]